MKKVKFLLLLLSLSLLAQTKLNLPNQIEQNKKLETCLQFCSNLADAEKYNQLIATADKGINLAKNNEIYLSKFYFYKGYGYEYDNNQYQNAIDCMEKSLFFAQKRHLLLDEVNALMRLNYNYFSNRNSEKREKLIAYIQKVADTTKNLEAKAILNGSLGEYHLDNANFEKFIDYKLKAIKYRKSSSKDANNDANIGVSYMQIADAFLKMKQFAKALEYTKIADKYPEQSAYGKAYNYYYFMECYNGLGDVKKLKSYYNAIYTLISSKDSLHFVVSRANRCIANNYLSNNNLTKATSYIDKATDAALKSNDLEILTQAIVLKGKILFEKKQYKEAIVILEDANKYTKDFEKEILVQSYKTLSSCYAALGNWRKAYQNHKIYVTYNNEILEESAKQSIANAEARYQNQAKKEQISTLNAQNSLKSIQIKTAKKQRIYLLLGVVIFAAIGFLFYNQSKKRNKLNFKLQQINQELDEANKIKTRFFSILNHDLRGPVANLIHFLHLQKNNPEMLDESSAERLQNQTITGAENLLGSMEDLLLWSKGQMQNFEPQLKNVTIDQLFEDTQKVFSGYSNIHFEYQNPDALELFTDENYLKTIIRNLTSNAINVFSATQNPRIVWRAWQTKSQTFLSITDNGPGASLEKFKALYDDTLVVGIKSGLGLHLIRDLAKAIECTITVDSVLHQNTCFILVFNNKS